MAKKSVTPNKIYENITTKFRHYYPSDYGYLLDVFEFAKKAHEGQKRASGEDYFIHPCLVAEILTDMGFDTPTLAAALLHDVVEDTSVTKEELESRYGKEVAALVAGVTKIDRLQFQTKEEEQAENIRKMLFAMANDIRVIMIKLADRLHNMRSINALPHDRQQIMARETLDIYAPIAGRLGLSYIKCELEDLCFKVLMPAEYEEIVDKIALKRSERQEFLNKVVTELSDTLRELGIEGEVSGRPKHFYSIYKKMLKKGNSFDRIFDLTAIRVIVKTVMECYTLLGTIHIMWKPLPGRVKDYIATPKPNRYQSLHTTVVTDFGQPFEIQIRTADMHKTAEYGVAAHWKYKENKAFAPDMKWVGNVTAMDTDIDSKEFLDVVKNEFSVGEIYVFSPKGDVINLVAGATPLDFAYSIHSEVGNKCVGVKVNGKIIPLDSTLETGDVVEVITQNNSKGPSRDWLQIVRSASAKAKIKQFLKRELKEEFIKTGKSMLEAEAKSKRVPLSDLLVPEALKLIYDRYFVNTLDELYASVGFGSINLAQAFNKLYVFYKKSLVPPLPKIESGIAKPTQKTSTQSIIIKGYDNFLIRFARCCNPLPGDDVIGFVSRGRGVSVHRRDCPSLNDLEKSRFIDDVKWSEKAHTYFTGTIVITAFDRDGLVANITKKIHNLDFKIVGINAKIDPTKIATLNVEVLINKADDINILIEKLRNYEPVIDIKRGKR